MSRATSPDDLDTRAARRAAARTTWQVAAVAGGVVVAVFALAVVFLLEQSRPSELLERPRPGEAKVYVDGREALVALILLGVLAVAVVAIAAWRISRRAVAPLGAALRIQRSFVADASHELRTPLTVLDTRLQVLQRKLDRGEPHRETLAAARGDTRAMIDLVTDLLLVAEAGETPTSPGAGCDLRPVVLSAGRDLALLAEERGVEVRVQVHNEARVRLSEVGLRRCLVVLIDNALAHSPDRAVVSVEARVERGRAVVVVADQGGGIRGIEPDRIFERFAHGEESGRRRGFGIGLALVRDLALRHGGTVDVVATSGGGTTMRLELPVER